MKSDAPIYPENGEIDIMPYYLDDPPTKIYNRYAASEKDVQGLIWLTKIKFIFYLVFLVFLQNCGNSNTKFYQGYVYSTEKKPIENISIYEIFDSINQVKTNKNGFFKMRISTAYISQFLIVKNEGKILDTIQIIYTHPERGERYYFVENRSDTLFIDKSKFENKNNL
ncbi:hypothetical protein [Bergeyella sp. RCAD1439]|uniref:hypothetical protein n=1 Tax=Bergeyella anatis TaxID=3113737 RepID=UPI002E189006|nr:hypothetical protein [Bergeyella sp. RCAD1439]